MPISCKPPADDGRVEARAMDQAVIVEIVIRDGNWYEPRYNGHAVVYVVVGAPQ
ncbi:MULTISPECIES: hypothetical protein [unclassified Rhizobium]|uniref:hypothetical protein n=1 Tax=unclassified Rhizobium TaxID=2613769 RepID=UPI0013C462DF|nr:MULTISPECIES: hypothetical protein [unclassified Rhizobium]